MTHKKIPQFSAGNDVNDVNEDRDISTVKKAHIPKCKLFSRKIFGKKEPLGASGARIKMSSQAHERNL